MEKSHQESNRAEKASLLDHIDEIEETNNENHSLYRHTNSQDKINANNSSVLISGKQINIE